MRPLLSLSLVAALAVGCRSDQGLTAVPPNEAPSTPEVAITPAEPTTVDDLLAVVTVDAVDPEGDAFTYQFSWTVDQRPVDETADTISAAATAVDQTWRVEVRAFDGNALGGAATASVVVLNTPPEVAAIAIAPDPATRLDDLTCESVGFDVDGHEVAFSYAWDVGGVAAGVARQLGAGAFVKGDVVTCTATPRDDRVDGEPASASVTIGNAPPEVADLEISPNPARTLDTLTCAGGGYDPDGDVVALTYAWEVDGAAMGVGPVLPPTAFVKGQTVACIATPSDGEDAGPSASVSLVIANTPPTAPEVAIAPAAPGVDDALVCRVASPATDADFDALTYTISWSVDGRAFTAATTTTLAGDTIPASATSDEEAWTCTIVASDGEAVGPAGSATVTVVGALDFTLFTTDAFLGSGSSSWLGDREAANAKCKSEATRLGIAGSDWRIVYSNPDEDAADFLLYDAARGDRVYDRYGTRVDSGDLWGGGSIRLPDLKSWTITGTGAAGTYKDCSGSYAPGTWPICQFCDRKFACASATDNPFNPSACCWTGTRAIVCMGTKD
jgi:hypothetical protein